METEGITNAPDVQEPEKEVFGFDEAIKHLKNGETVTRLGWNNPNIKVLMQVPDENSKMNLPYLYMEKGESESFRRFPLDLSVESIFAEDWTIVV